MENKIVEEIVEEYVNGKDNPPDVVIREMGREKMRWSFIYDPLSKRYFAELNVNMPSKVQPLGSDRKEAIRLYNSVIVQKEGAKR